MGILRMMKNAFGNYVVQRLYEYCDEDAKNRIYAKINQPDILNELRKNNYGNKFGTMKILIFSLKFFIHLFYIDHYRNPVLFIWFMLIKNLKFR